MVQPMSTLADFAADRLRDMADPEKAAAMAAYMKTSDPFYGVQKPGRKTILAELLDRFPITTPGAYEAAVTSLWARPHREEKYLALAVASGVPRFITFDAMPLYRRLIVEGAWWDFVDDVATRCVGRVWLDERPPTTELMWEWIDDESMWLRRTAIIGQLKHKADTDEDVLFSFCARRAHEKEFFIRKAIGWALRQYARTAPDAVTRFVVDNRERLSRLSFREATRHLDVG